MWRKCCLALPKSLSTHQKPSGFHSVTLKIPSSSVLCLKETLQITVCVHAHMQTSLHVAVFLPVLTPYLLSNHTNSGCLSDSWPLGNCLVMNPAPADLAAQKGKKAPKYSNQKMRDSEMDELSADVQLFVSVRVCVRACVCEGS